MGGLGVGRVGLYWSGVMGSGVVTLWGLRIRNRPSWGYDGLRLRKSGVVIGLGFEAGWDHEGLRLRRSRVEEV